MWKKLIIMITLLIMIGGGVYVYQRQQHQQLPEYIASSNGRLELARLDIATLYAGRVDKIYVNEGDHVTADMVLIELSSEQSSSQLAVAKAAQTQVQETVKKAHAETSKAQEAVAQAKAAVVQAQENVAKANAHIMAQRQQLRIAQLEWDNAKQLKRDQLISSSELQRREAAKDSALAAVQAAEASKAEAQAGVLQAQINVTTAQAAVVQAQAQAGEAQAGVARAKAQVDAARSANQDMLIRAPINARVEYRLVNQGSVVGAGSKIISLLDPTDVSMSIFVPTTIMSRLKVGDDARIVLDGIDAVLPAKISFIATEAQFTPKTVETVNERAKLMFKVKLAIPKETAAQLNGLLKGGMTGNGFVKTDSTQNWGEHLMVKLPK